MTLTAHEMRQLLAEQETQVEALLAAMASTKPVQDTSTDEVHLAVASHPGSKVSSSQVSPRVSPKYPPIPAVPSSRLAASSQPSSHTHSRPASPNLTVSAFQPHASSASLHPVESSSDAHSANVTTHPQKRLDFTEDPVPPVFLSISTNMSIGAAETTEASMSKKVDPPPQPPVNPATLRVSSTSSAIDIDSIMCEIDVGSDAGLNSENGDTTHPRALHSSANTEERRRFKRTCIMVWSKLAEHRFGNVFTRAEKGPFYLSVIKEPINLTMIKNRIRDGEISTMEEFQKDILQMLANAVMFNDENSEISHMAKVLCMECCLSAYFTDMVILQSLKLVVESELAAIENVRRMRMVDGE